MRPDALIDLHCDTLSDDIYTDLSTPDTVGCGFPRENLC